MGDGCRTPFDLMRLALEALERHGHLSRSSTVSSSGLMDQSSSFSSSIVTDTDLIQALDDASTILHRCLDNNDDPQHSNRNRNSNNNNQNLDCHCWYVATRVAILCIGSGIVIGNGTILAAPPEHFYEGKTTMMNHHGHHHSSSSSASSGVYPTACKGIVIVSRIDGIVVGWGDTE